MSKQVLKIIKESMKELGIAYDFMVYKAKPIVYPYFVGEYNENEATTEDGLQTSTFLLTGFSRGEWQTLENAKEVIAKYFDAIAGHTGIAENGAGIAISYAGASSLPTGDDSLQKIQINLSVKEWSV